MIVLHGGPGAPGSAAGLARGIGQPFHVYEPFQRRRDDRPLTVARHVGDLQQFIEQHCEVARPAVVGHSWGAMLALAHAAEHPQSVAGVALVGCGTFDPAARSRFEQLCDERGDGDAHRARARLEADGPDPQQRLARWAALLRPIYAFDPIGEDPADWFDAPGHGESWEDMLRLQREGVHPAAFARFRGRVVMLHGDFDPHPGPMIRDSLLPVLPQLEYRQFDRCGHEPWAERHARRAFFEVLRNWLASALPTD